jgi:hypothetical protein
MCDLEIAPCVDLMPKLLVPDVIAHLRFEIGQIHVTFSVTSLRIFSKISIEVLRSGSGWKR